MKQRMEHVVNQLKSWRSVVGALVLALVAVFAVGATTQAKQGANINGTLPNIVLVHGAWADGSSWTGVIQRLQREGFYTTAVQLPLTSLDEDVATVRRVLNEQDGPTILVAHSYGGAVISALGTDAPNVVGLVYVAAFGPDEGETLEGILSQGPPLPDGLLQPDQFGFVWLSRDGFLQYFAPDVPPREARAMAAFQKPIFYSVLGEHFGEPSWKSIPSWYLVAKQDQIIPPAAQHFFAQRMGATMVSVPASHVVLVSRPVSVVNLIIKAAEATSN